MEPDEPQARMLFSAKKVRAGEEPQRAPPCPRPQGSSGTSAFQISRACLPRPDLTQNQERKGSWREGPGLAAATSASMVKAHKVLAIIIITVAITVWGACVVFLFVYIALHESVNSLRDILVQLYTQLTRAVTLFTPHNPVS